MQYFYTTNISSHNEKKSVLTRLASSATVLAVSIMLMHSSVTLAGSTIKNAGQQMAQNSEEYNSRSSIDRTEMTAKTKSKLSSKDNKIGAFSMEDEARDGFYGDGEYVD